MIRIPAKIPISIYPWFWILAAFIGWINTFNLLETSIWIAIIVVSVLVHEYGHALTAIFFGQRAKIDLVAFGGVTQRQGGALKTWQEFMVVFNGPLAGFLLSLGAFFTQKFINFGSHSLMGYALQVSFLVNLFWTILNLVPVHPLDGGKLLSIVLESFLGLKGIKIAFFISLILSGLLGLLFFAIHAVIAGIVFLMLTFENYKAWKDSLHVTENDQNLFLQNLLKEAEKEMHLDHREEALNKFQQIREITQSGTLYSLATEHTAQLLAERGDWAEAYHMLSPINKQLGPMSLRLLHQLAYRQGQWKEAVFLGTRSYQSHPAYDTAVLNALSLSLLGEIKPAIGWLQCAIRDGLPNPREVLAKKEFDPIRSDPSFQVICSQY